MRALPPKGIQPQKNDGWLPRPAGLLRLATITPRPNFDAPRWPVTDSRDPEHDLARALLARGIKGNVTLHDGPTRKPRTVVNIEKAAPWCVGSNLERYKWKAPEVSDSSPHTGEDGYLVLPTMPDDDKAVA